MLDDVGSDQVVEGLVGKGDIQEVAQRVDPGGLDVVVGLFLLVVRVVFQVLRVQECLTSEKMPCAGYRQGRASIEPGTQRSRSKTSRAACNRIPGGRTRLVRPVPKPLVIRVGIRLLAELKIGHTCQAFPRKYKPKNGTAWFPSTHAR